MKLADYVRFRQALLDEATDMGISIDGMAPLPKDMLKTIDGVKPLDAVSPDAGVHMDPPDPDGNPLRSRYSEPPRRGAVSKRVRVLTVEAAHLGLTAILEKHVWEALGCPNGSDDLVWCTGSIQQNRGLRRVLHGEFRAHGWVYDDRSRAERRFLFDPALVR